MVEAAVMLVAVEGARTAVVEAIRIANPRFPTEDDISRIQRKPVWNFQAGFLILQFLDSLKLRRLRPKSVTDS